MFKSLVFDWSETSTECILANEKPEIQVIALKKGVITSCVHF
jgi:hypothetical protein